MMKARVKLIFTYFYGSFALKFVEDMRLLALCTLFLSSVIDVCDYKEDRNVK